MSNEPCRKGTLRSCENVVGESMPTIVPLLGKLPVLTRLRGNGKGMKGVPTAVVPEVLVLVPEVLVLLPEVLVLLVPEVLLPLVLVPLVLLPLVLLLEMTGESEFSQTQLGVGNVVLQVEVEVDADRFKEIVVDGDEAALDSHLQVLEPPQLLEQIANFVVDFLRLADDQAQRRFEGRHRAGPPASSHDSGSMVETMRCLMESKSAWPMALAGCAAFIGGARRRSGWPRTADPPA